MLRKCPLEVGRGFSEEQSGERVGNAALLLYARPEWSLVSYENKMRK